MDTKQARQAAEVQTNARTAFAAIRDNGQLSDLGKRQQLHHVHSAASAKLVELRKSEADQLAARVTELEGKLFGDHRGVAGAELVSLRDATDRAASLKKPADALTAMQTALKIGDKQVANAIARRAVELDWADVFAAWREAHPQFEPVIAELVSIEQHQGKHAPFRFALPRPVELKGTPDERGQDAAPLPAGGISSSNALFRD